MDDRQGSKRAPGLTRGQMATALRIGSGAVDAGRLPGHPEAWAGTDGSRDPARGLGRTGAGITLAMVVAGTLAVSVVTGNRGNLGDSGDGPPSAGGGRGSIQRGGVGTGAIQATDSRQEQQKMFGRLTGVAAATAVGVSTTIAGAQATAVQWRVEDGGNGHWYQVCDWGHIAWFEALNIARARGGHLATLNSAVESRFVGSLLLTDRAIFLGGFQDRTAPDYAEPSGGWRWVTGEPWSYENWIPGEPNNSGNVEDYLLIGRNTLYGDQWNDGESYCGPCQPPYVAVEFDADCNNDGVVDYGQILNGQFSDRDLNGVPDVCQPPSCMDADIFRDFNVNGADLGILLSQWGPHTPLTVSDINGDMVVNGADLGLLLSFWGPCAP